MSPRPVRDSRSAKAPRPLRLTGGPFDGAVMLARKSPAKLCAAHTGLEPADVVSRAMLALADQKTCAAYVRERPMPKSGPIAFRHKPEWGAVDATCYLKRIPARHSLGLAIHEAQRAAQDPDAAKEAERKELPDGAEPPDPANWWKKGKPPA